MQAKVFEIVCDVLQVDISTVSLKTSMENIDKWDSLKQMQIVIARHVAIDHGQPSI